MRNKSVQERIQQCREERNDFLDLGNCGLTEVPTEVFDLVHLRRLNLGKRYYEEGKWNNTKFNGGVNQIPALPEMLKRLKNLEELSLEGNLLKDLTSLQYLPKLKRLNIGNTRVRNLDLLQHFPQLSALCIKGLHIRSLLEVTKYALPNLIALDASKNQLQKIEGLEEVPNLEHLNLSINRISEVEGIDGLVTLKSLYLGLNRISKIKNLTNLSELKTLSFGYLGGHYEEYVLVEYYRSNFIQRIEGLEELINLETLDLSGSLIKEIEGLDNQKDLIKLYLGHNQIKIIKGIDHFDQLKFLSFGYHTDDYQVSELFQNNDLFRDYAPLGNHLTKVEGIESLSELVFLSLDSNKISIIDGLEELKKLEILNLSQNQITRIKNLDALANLQHLNLDSNQISEIKNLDALANLQSLDLNSNQISEIENLDALANLQYLTLWSNQISEIKNLDALANLQSIDLDSNQISEIKNLDALANLQFLDLDSNQISEIKNLDALANLQSLHLSSNQISEIKNLDALANLQYLGLNSNQISEIKNLDALANLQSLGLNSNQISEIKNLDALANLQYLGLNSNQISEIKNLDALANLQSLHLSSNQISEIKNLDALANLQYLTLWSNQISEIKNLDALANLQSIDLDSNQISEIKNLDALANLQSLHLSSNQISEIKNLDALANLQYLTLWSNQISEIKNLDALANLQSIDLDSNQISEIKNLDALANLQSLHLSSNQISEIKNLDALANLQYLGLDSNQISEIKNLDALANLQHLNLDSNQISEIKNLDALANLQFIDLDSNQISEIKNLDALANLQSLHLSSNQISEIKNLDALVNLQHLNLDSNQISEIKNLDVLANLQSLHLSSNQISEIKNLDALANLQFLDLNSNHISEIENLDALANLQFLGLNSNQISEIKNLDALPYLQHVLLSKNQVSDLSPLYRIPLLAELQIAQNDITSFDRQLLELPNIVRFFLEKNEFKNLPSEIANLENCISDAKAWFWGLDRESTENYEVKLMLVGNGRVGKTSILKRLLLDQFNLGEDSTHGIQLFEKEMPIELFPQPLKIQAWDFGGQEVYHATHRLFMQSRALYLAIWDWETEQQPFATEQIAGQTVRFRNFKLNYWLDHARSLSWRSPLFVVQNKLDLHGRKWPDHFEQLQKRYDIINFFNISAAKGNGIALLKAAILEEFKNMREVGMRTPAQWQRVKEKLLGLKEQHKTISFDFFQEICWGEELNSTSIEALIRFLHNTGAVFYQYHLFQNKIILDQEWALEGLYALFQRGPFFKQLKFAGGRTSLSILEWPWQKYDLDTRKIFLSMMESCEICFQITEDKQDPEYIITEFLSDEKDQKIVNFWEKTTPRELFLRYQTNFFHPAFITRFITRAGRLAENFDHIWRNGIWITYNNAHALIEAFPEDHQILVRVKGEPGIILLFLINKAFREIFYEPDSVAMEISMAGQEFLSYQEVKEGKERGFKKVITKSRQMVELEDVDFFADVLEAKSEDEVKRMQLADIVPKPRIKQSEEQVEIDEDWLQKFKRKLKTEAGRNLDKALSLTCNLTVNGGTQNEIITIQGRYNDLKNFQNTGQLDFDEYNRHNNQIRSALLKIIDRIDNEDVDQKAAMDFLGNQT